MVRMEEIRWTDRRRNEDVLNTAKCPGGKKHLTYNNKERLTGLVTSCIGTAH
jgi:hypothetical protein